MENFVKNKRKEVFKMTIFEKARELGEMIQETEEFKALKAAEVAQAEDENAKTLLMEFNLRRMNLGRDIQEGKITEAEAIEQNNKAFDELLEKSEVIKNYVESQQALDKVVTEINNILTYYITGQTPGGCSHDCSSCSGCH